MPSAQVHDRLHRGQALLRRGLLAAAKEEFGTLLARGEQEGDPSLPIAALNGLAAVAMRRKDFEGAYQLVERARAIADGAEVGKRERLPIYLNLTHLLTELDRLDEALTWAIRAAGLVDNKDEMVLRLTHWLNVSRLHWRRQEWVPMMNASLEAHRLAETSGDQAMDAWALASLGIANLELGLYQGAEEQFHRALTLTAAPDPEVAAHVHAEWGRLYFLQGKYDSALEYGRRALDALVTGVSVFDKQVVAAVSRLFGSIFSTYGQRNLALKFLNRAAAYYSQLGWLGEWRRATEAIGEVLAAPRSRTRPLGYLEVQRLDFLTAVLDMTDDLESVDPMLREHSERTATLAVLLGEELGLDPHTRRTLGLAAWLHDVGKVALEEPDAPLHAALGEEMLRPHALSPLVLAAIRHHHEHFDGSGSPEGLKGEEIPLLARIIAVVDKYDELTADLDRRPGMSHREAVQRLEAAAGIELDPHLVQRFLRLFEV